MNQLPRRFLGPARSSLPSWRRNKIFTPGDRQLTTAMVYGIKVAILICADSRSLCLSRKIRRARVDIVLASLADNETNHSLFHLMGVFYDSWILVANRYGEENSRMWPGLITITDPWAKLHASGIGKEQVLVQRLVITNPSRPGRWLRRILVGLRLLGVASVLMIQSCWAAKHQKAQEIAQSSLGRLDEPPKRRMSIEASRSRSLPKRGQTYYQRRWRWMSPAIPRGVLRPPPG